MRLSKRFQDFPGQIDLFDYLKSLEEEDDYLSKGERLTTLARERFQRLMDRLSFTKLEETIFSTKLPTYTSPTEIVTILAKNVVRPLLRAMTTFDEKDEAYMELKGVIDFDFSLSNAEGLDFYGAYKYLRYRGKKTSDQLLLTIREEGFRELQIFGYRMFSLPKSQNGRIALADKTGIYDIGLALSWLICFTLYNRALADENMESALREAFEEEKLTTRDHYALKNYILMSSGIKDYSVELDPDIPCYSPYQTYKGVSEAVKEEFFNQTGCQIVGESRLTDMVLKNKNNECLANLSNPKPYGFLIEPGVEWILFMRDPLRCFKAGMGKAKYNAFLSRYNEKPSDKDALPFMYPNPVLLRSINTDAFSIVFNTVLRAVWKKKGVIAKVAAYYNGLSSEGRAKVYQTKKNIPLKVLKDMKESELNEHFGYVEFDESCDLESLKKVTLEFGVFMDQYLSDLDLKTVSIRFRLLGNHRAAGLYFPSINCLCVDVRHPHSFIHEVGHAIDYLHDSLSEKTEFSKVYEHYKSAFLSDTPRETLYHLQTTKSKYNLDYFLMYTEVFARCMEIYVSRVLKQTLSICKVEEEMDWAYPVNDVLLKEITEYFYALFARLNTHEKVTGDDIAA